MSPSSTAASVGVGVLLLVAWLASALNAPRAPQIEPRRPDPPRHEQLSELRADVRMQASRLRERLAKAPAPAPAARNPFRFAPRPAPTRAERAAAAEPDLPAADRDLPSEPVLALIGIAEHRKDDAIARTAIVTGLADELYLVAEGDQIAGVYRVRAIGASAVELEHLATGAIRRLHLQ